MTPGSFKVSLYSVFFRQISNSPLLETQSRWFYTAREQNRVQNITLKGWSWKRGWKEIQASFFHSGSVLLSSLSQSRKILLQLIHLQELLVPKVEKSCQFEGIKFLMHPAELLMRWITCSIQCWAQHCFAFSLISLLKSRPSCKPMGYRHHLIWATLPPVKWVMSK